MNWTPARPAGLGSVSTETATPIVRSKNSSTGARQCSLDPPSQFSQFSISHLEAKCGRFGKWPR